MVLLPKFVISYFDKFLRNTRGNVFHFIYNYNVTIGLHGIIDLWLAFPQSKPKCLPAYHHAPPMNIIEAKEARDKAWLSSGLSLNFFEACNEGWGWGGAGGFIYVSS